MDENTKDFLDRNKISTYNVMYILRNGRKSLLHLDTGKDVETYIPIKKILKELNSSNFEIINRGIVISTRFVSKVEKSVYTMTDGKQFVGRIRTCKSQIEEIKEKSQQNIENSLSGFKILDKLPLAFCIIELIFNENGKGIDFIFRYCNKEMENFEGKKLEEMIGRSFYEVFENGDKKWLATYADVALNGTTRVIEDYSPEVDSNIRIYCYQPKPNFCACAMMKI